MRAALGKRLTKLEPRRLAPPGCRECHGWQPYVLVGDDGPHRPGRCPGCGRIVPTTLVYRVVGVRIADL